MSFEKWDCKPEKIPDESFTKRVKLFVVFLPFSLAPFFTMIFIMRKRRKNKPEDVSNYWMRDIFIACLTAVLAGVCLAPLMILLSGLDLPLLIQNITLYIGFVVIALAMREVDYWNCRKTAEQIAKTMK